MISIGMQTESSRTATDGGLINSLLGAPLGE